MRSVEFEGLEIDVQNAIQEINSMFAGYSSNREDSSNNNNNNNCNNFGNNYDQHNARVQRNDFEPNRPRMNHQGFFRGRTFSNSNNYNNFQQGRNYQNDGGRDRSMNSRNDFNSGYGRNTYQESNSSYPRNNYKNNNDYGNNKQEVTNNWVHQSHNPPAFNRSNSQSADACNQQVDDWSMEEMKANFKPSLNTYQCSNNDLNDFTKRSTSNASEHRFHSGSNNYNNNSNFNSGGYKPRYDKFEANKTTSNEDYRSVAIDWDKVNQECDAARKERWAKCPTLIKEFYTEHPNTTSMTQEEIEAFRKENNNISVSRVFDELASVESMPKPVTEFEYAFGSYPELLNEVKKQGFAKPSPIQSQMWPILLRGEDCIGIGKPFFPIQLSKFICILNL
jgi:hypothetical protein